MVAFLRHGHPSRHLQFRLGNGLLRQLIADKLLIIVDGLR